MQKHGTDDIILRRTLNWDELRYFLAAAETGSLNQAAQKLGVTQPTLSRRIDSLEHSLGARLFTRQPQGIELTDAGRRVLIHAQRMQSSAVDIDRAVSGADNAMKGNVRILSQDGFAAFWMLPHLHEFHFDHPDIRIELLDDCPAARAADIPAEIAIQTSEADQLDAVAYPLGTMHFCLFATQAYVERWGRPENEAELENHRFISHHGLRHGAQDWAATLLKAGETCRTILECSSGAAVHQAVRQDLGIAALPTCMTATDRSLVQLAPDLTGSTRFWAVFHRETGELARVRAAIDWLKRICSPRVSPHFAQDFVPPAELFDKTRESTTGDRVGTASS